MTGLHSARYLFIVLLLIFALCGIWFARKKVD
jgi:hypothetical protein